MRRALALLLVAPALSAPPPAFAAWAPNGIPLCTATGAQFGASAVPDGTGGAIVAFSGGTVFAQRVAFAGEIPPGWPPNGRALCVGPGGRSRALAAPDGSGGAFVAWEDTRNGPPDLFAQHVLGGGALDPAWPDTGLAVAVAPLNQYMHAVAADGAGGLLAVWQDDQSGDLDIRAQRVNAAGAALWAANGVAVCDAAGSQFLPQVIGDGAGGAFVAWVDERSGAARVYALRLTPEGAVAPGWPPNGLALGNPGPIGAQHDAVLASDGAGGTLVAWSGSNNKAIYHPFVLRLTGSGAIAAGWPAAGVQLCSQLQTQDLPQIVSDRVGGAIVVWRDFRDITNPQVNYDIYAQRVSAAGAPLWMTDGAPVCTAPGVQNVPAAVSDDQGGVVVAWEDSRGADADIYAVRLRPGGTRASGWDPDGTPLCALPGDQGGPTLVPDRVSGAIVAWTDSRPAPRFQAPDIYAAKTIDDLAVPVLVSVVSAEARSDRVSLVWQVTQAGVRATVERRAQGEDWREVGAAVSSGDGSIRFEDAAVSAGSGYDYRLRLTQEGGEVVAGEVRVEVPTGFAFGLEGARPNPAAGALEVVFSLPDAAPAALAVMDVSGRVIASRAVGPLGAGRHVIRAANTPLPPGLYYLRLTRAGRALTARAVVLP